MPFLIDLHITMFFALLAAGTICTVWGLALFIARYQAMKNAALEAGRASKQQNEADNTPAAPAASAQAGASRPKPKPQADTPQAAPDTQALPRRSLISPLFRSALRVTGYLALIQVVIGGLIFFFLPNNRPADQLHYVYGLVVLLAIPLALTYISGKPEHVRRDMLFLIGAALVVAAAAVRAALTGGFQF